MYVVLDTTIQIDKVFGTKERIAAIDKAIGSKERVSTIYVFGEYCATILSDCVTMHSIISVYNDLNEAERKITERAFGRHKDRMHKIFIFLRDKYNNDIADIKQSFELTIVLLIHKFNKGLSMPLLDGAKCNRANFEINYLEGKPMAKNLNCRKTDNHCEISILWKKHFNAITGLHKIPHVNDDIKEFMIHATEETPPRGNICKTFGDCIICLEAIENNIDVICTSNKKDFEILACHFGLKLIVPNYKQC